MTDVRGATGPRRTVAIPEDLLSEFSTGTNAAYEFGVGARKRIEASDFDVTVRAIELAAGDDSGTWAGRGSLPFVE